MLDLESCMDSESHTKFSIYPEATWGSSQEVPWLEFTFYHLKMGNRSSEMFKKNVHSVLPRCNTKAQMD